MNCANWNPPEPPLGELYFLYLPRAKYIIPELSHHHYQLKTIHQFIPKKIIIISKKLIKTNCTYLYNSLPVHVPSLVDARVYIILYYTIFNFTYI